MEHISLFELNGIIRETLEQKLEASYWVVAEIAELRQNQKGHCYLEFVEKEDELILAKSRATIWSYAYRKLSAWFESITGQPLQQGMKILAKVQVQYHEIYGMSLNVKDIDPNFTIGERARKRQEVLKKLEEDGILEMNKQLPLPTVPQKLAIISSPTAAGYEDFMNHLAKNSFGYSLRTELFPASMQGAEAPKAIVEALHKIFEQETEFDLVLLIRGGGAQLDLDSFDNYQLASHLAQFPLPIVTGIGHERDETIADLVAHTKMKTPTAAAEFIISGIRTYEESLEEAFARIYELGGHKMAVENQTIESLVQRFVLTSKSILNREEIQLDNHKTNLIATSRRFLAGQNDTLGEVNKSLKNNSEAYLVRCKNEIEHLDKTVHLLDPKKVLSRGYSITVVNGKPIKSVMNVKKGDKLVTETSNGKIKSTAD